MSRATFRKASIGRFIVDVIFDDVTMNILDVKTDNLDSRRMYTHFAGASRVEADGNEGEKTTNVEARNAKMVSDDDGLSFPIASSMGTA